ncbi:hypothetical protein ACR782_12385 [Sphingobacterium spiritivorum]|uniref:hypothetical protein n=1 Tax=Sphingobacterium spiritivorum TaxID=258 RepID=UPI003DA2B370
MRIRYLILILIILKCCAIEAQQSTVPVSRSNLGKLTDPRMQEASGLVASSVNKQHFWTHNDSGDEGRIFLIDNKARLRAIYTLEGVDAVDCEDIAWLEIDGEPYLLLADIGDNLAHRSFVSLYLFKEPMADTSRLVHRIPKEQIRHIPLRYPDKARDAEAIIVLPENNQIMIFSKRDFRTGIYVSDVLGDSLKNDEQLKKVGELPFNFITAADISRDGRQLIMKNLTNVYYWKLDPPTGILENLKKPFVKLPYSPEPQGEAIAFDLDGTCFYTLSEQPFGLSSYLYQYKFYNYDQNH